MKKLFNYLLTLALLVTPILWAQLAQATPSDVTVSITGNPKEFLVDNSAGGERYAFNGTTSISRDGSRIVTISYYAVKDEGIGLDGDSSRQRYKAVAKVLNINTGHAQLVKLTPEDGCYFPDVPPDLGTLSFGDIFSYSIDNVSLPHLSVMISGNGRYLTFTSCRGISTLNTDDIFSIESAARRTNVYLHDLDTLQTELISVGTNGEYGNNYSLLPYISNDGRYVTFISSSSNLIAGGTYYLHAYIRDRFTGTTELVSQGISTILSASASSLPVSDNGQFVAFTAVSDLSSTLNEPRVRTYRRDRTNNATSMVSGSNAGPDTAYFVGRFPTMSADGSKITFQSSDPGLDSANIGPNYTPNAKYYAYVKDMTANTYKRIADPAGEGAFNASLSPDGSTIAFGSKNKLYRHYLNSSLTIAVTPQLLGTPIYPTVVPWNLSEDGSLIVYSVKDSLVSDDTNNKLDAYVTGPIKPLLPINFQVVPSMTPKNVQLTWEKPYGYPVDQYNIYRGTSSSSLQLIATVSGNINIYTDNVGNEPAYFYAVSASNAAGESSQTEPVIIVNPWSPLP